MNYLYTVGYTSYEECPKVMLLSDKQYTEEEFDALVVKLSVQVVKEKFEADPDAHVHNYGDVYDEVCKKLIDEYLFIPATTQASFRPFGWPSIFDLDDWKEERDERLDKVTKAHLEAGFDSSYDGSKRFSAKCEERRAEERAAEANSSENEPSKE